MRWICVLVAAAAVAGCGHGRHSTAIAPTRGIPCPAHTVARLDARRLIGLPEARASQVAAKSSCMIRVVERDGRQLTVTADYSNYRIDVAVRHGVIVGVPFIG